MYDWMTESTSHIVASLPKHCLSANGTIRKDLLKPAPFALRENMVIRGNSDIDEKSSTGKHIEKLYFAFLCDYRLSTHVIHTEERRHSVDNAELESRPHDSELPSRKEETSSNLNAMNDRVSSARISSPALGEEVK